MSQKKRYKLGIIGAGVITEGRIIPALLSTKEFDISCAFDNNAVRLKYISTKYQIKGVSSLDELFADDCAAVYIATPNSSHAELAIQSLKHGKAVLLEKPCADTLESANALLSVSRNANQPLLVGYMSKWNRHNQLVQRLVAENKIGALRTITATFGWYNQDMDAWRLFRSQSGPGALADIGIYPISTALDLFGEMPFSCVAQAYPAGHPVYGDKFLSGRVNFSGGRWLQLDVSFLSQSCGYTVVGTDGVIHIEGSWAQSGEGEIVVCNGNRVERVFADAVNPYEEEFLCFKECLDGSPVPAFMGIERAVEDIRVMAALDSSAAQMGAETAVE